MKILSSLWMVLLFPCIVLKTVYSESNGTNMMGSSASAVVTFPAPSVPAGIPSDSETSTTRKKSPEKKAKRPEVSCPEFCVCSELENSLNCNGDRIFPFPVGLPPYNFSRVLLQHFAKNDLRAVDIHLLTNNGSRDLEEVRIPRNGLSQIKNNVFAGLNGLKRLDLSANKLSQITNSTFIGLSSLVYLDLSSNRIAAIDPGSFAYLHNLIQLDLSSNKLASIPNDLFLGLVHLQYLNLEVNQITQLEPNSLASLAHLVHLNLAFNPLRSVDEVSFEQTNLLQYCDLSHCNMRTIPRNLPKDIHDIRLTGNNLGEITSGMLGRYKSLTILVFDECNLTKIDDESFRGLSALQRLWLSGNRLARIPHNLPSSLKALFLEENLIKAVLAGDIHDLADLEELHLRRNLLSHIEPCAFCSMDHLHLLDLSSNRLGHLNATLFSSANILSTLDLSLNPVRQITPAFLQHLSSLRQLDVSRVDSHISSDDLGGALRNAHLAFAHMQSLDISGNPRLIRWFFNSIAQMEKNISLTPPDLHTINIRNCQISEFPAILQALFARLSKIKIGQNPIMCDLRNEWLIQMIQSKPKIFYKAPELKCAGPAYLKSQSILTVPLSLLRIHNDHMDHSSPEMAITDKLHHMDTEVLVPMWTFVLVTSLLSSLLICVLLVYFVTGCSFKALKAKQFSLRHFMCRLLWIPHEPFPELAASSGTLYSTTNESIYTISTDVPSLVPQPAEMSEFSTFRSESRREDDDASVSSEFHSYREFLV